jgi:hypothetical protein
MKRDAAIDRIPGPDADRDGPAAGGAAPDARRAPGRDPEAAPPWEMVGFGRYMPRRIRGSFRGRELG